MELRQIIIKELPPPAILVNIKLYLIFLLSTTIIFLQWLSMDYICCLSEEWQWCRNYLEKRFYLLFLFLLYLRRIGCEDNVFKVCDDLVGGRAL